ncbi:MAG: hypothetical protein PHU46_02735 [Rhodocyclaceae bacterium]|nr:hypothetical protein [Rhodocyclaceae bacterium]
MNLLQGSIAFALALAGLATLCTALIEILHRLFGLRSDGLKKMLEAYFDDVVKPRLSGDVGKLRADMMTKLTGNALLEKIHPLPAGGHGLWGHVLGLYRNRLLRANAVTTEQFLQRLPDTALFQHLKTDTLDQANAQLKQLADKYDQYGAAATDYFKRRAQMLSLIMGIALALFGNIHAVRIFDTFVQNPEVAQRMATQADAIKAQIDRQAPAAADAKAQLDQTKADLAKVSTSLSEYQAMGLPIGWNYYPNCLGTGKGDPRCKALNLKDKAGEAPGTPCSVMSTLGQDPGGALMWLFAVLLTGVLIGLGGPFWFDLAMRLSQVRQAFGGNAPAGQSAAPAPPAGKDQAIANAAGQLAPAVPATQGRQPWEDKPW